MVTKHLDTKWDVYSKYGFQGEILQRLWEWIENIQVACCFPGIWKVMFDETSIIQPLCCITEPTLHSCMEFRRQCYDSLRLLHDIKYSICRLQIRCDFSSTKNSSSHKIQIGEKKNTQASPRTVEIYCFHVSVCFDVSNFFKLPLFIKKTLLKTHSNPTLMWTNKQIEGLGRCGFGFLESCHLVVQSCLAPRRFHANVFSDDAHRWEHTSTDILWYALSIINHKFNRTNLGTSGNCKHSIPTCTNYLNIHAPLII